MNSHTGELTRARQVKGGQSISHTMLPAVWRQQWTWRGALVGPGNKALKGMALKLADLMDREVMRLGKRIGTGKAVGEMD